MTSKHVLFVLGCLYKANVSTTVRFFSTATHDIYIISRLSLFREYFEDRLRQALEKKQEMSVIIVNDSPQILFEVMVSLNRETAPNELPKLREAYAADYKKQLLRAAGSTDLGISNFDVKLPPGHCELPLRFRTCIVLDCDGYNELRHLEEKSVSTQQVLRYIALKHGATFAAVSGLLSAVDDAASILTLASSLFSSAMDPELQVYDFKGSSICKDVILHQHVSSAWDTWSKIVLLAKALPELHETDALASESKIQELDDLYTDAVVNSDGSDALDALLRLETSLETLLGVKKVDEHIETPPSYQQMLESLKESFP